MALTFLNFTEPIMIVWILINNYYCFLSRGIPLFSWRLWWQLIPQHGGMLQQSHQTMESCCTNALQSKLLCHSSVWWISLCSWRLWTILSQNCWTVWPRLKFMGNDACNEHLQNQFWSWSFEWMSLCSRWANVLHFGMLVFQLTCVYVVVEFFCLV